LILGLLIAAALAGEPAQLVLGGATVEVEVASTPQERARGLMGRVSLLPDQGMLFIYPDEAERSFWMKNTPLPLSIAFIGAGGRIVHITDMKPLNEDPVPSGHAAMYALEMTKGWFESHGVMVGQSIAGLPEASGR
jgi:uncharacterized membrane protein (UPF0127 family)